MLELTPENIPDYLLSSGRIPPGTPCSAKWLTGGVSNAVFLVSLPGTPQNTPSLPSAFILKQSRDQLRTRIEWFSRKERIFREIHALKLIQSLLPSSATPRFLFDDPPNYLYAMEAIPPEHHVWKHDLLAGHLDLNIPSTLGTYLGTIHSRTQHLTPPLDQTLFDELRLDPYYRTIAAVHPQLAPTLHQLIDSTLAIRASLVLADFSPKNTLVLPGRVVLIDFETAHTGDPAFDLGFFLTHLVLKSIHLPHLAPDFLTLINTFYTSYCAQLTSWNNPHLPLESLHSRSVLHLAACMLARIDGKSPVDYLTPNQQSTARSLAISLLQSPPPSLPAALPRIFPAT